MVTVRRPPDKQRGPAANRAPQRSDTSKHQIDPTVARDRARAIERRRAARELELLAPLAAYYGPRRPRPIPLGRFLAEGWWAA